MHYNNNEKQYNNLNRKSTIVTIIKPDKKNYLNMQIIEIHSWSPLIIASFTYQLVLLELPGSTFGF